MVRLESVALRRVAQAEDGQLAVAVDERRGGGRGGRSVGGGRVGERERGLVEVGVARRGVPDPSPGPRTAGTADAQLLRSRSPLVDRIEARDNTTP